MYYYPHHVGDYQRDTAHLTLLEHGVYRLLLDTYYATERPLPDDPALLCRIVRAHTKAEREAVASVMRMLFHKDADGLRHHRADREIEHFQQNQEKASKAGILSGQKRRQTAAGKAAGTPAAAQAGSGGEEAPLKSAAALRPMNGRSTDVQHPLNQPGTNNHNQEPQVSDADGGEGSPVPPGKEGHVSTPALETVRQWAEVVMAPEACADVFWNDHEARGWSDKTGQRIKNFRAAFNSFATRWKDVRAERAARAHGGLLSTGARSDSANVVGRYG